MAEPTVKQTIIVNAQTFLHTAIGRRTHAVYLFVSPITPSLRLSVITACGLCDVACIR